MVATSGSGWRLAPSLAAMVREADRIAPRRSEASDGSIGDWSHRLRKSSHNKAGGYVDAVDLTHDPAHGWDAHARARQVASRRDPRIEQIISDRRQWRNDGRGWRSYWGINPHRSHAHFGVKRNAQGRTSTASWWGNAPTPAPAPAPPPTPPPPPTGDLMYRILWFQGEPTAAGPQSDQTAAYRCLMGKAEISGQFFPVLAFYLDGGAYALFKGEGLKEDPVRHPIASSSKTVLFYGGPFNNT